MKKQMQIIQCLTVSQFGALKTILTKIMMQFHESKTQAVLEFQQDCILLVMHAELHQKVIVSGNYGQFDVDVLESSTVSMVNRLETYKLKAEFLRS